MDPETTEATVITDPESGEPEAVIVELPETEAELTAENPAVAIAAIEAERDVTIAAIHADTEAAHIEARSEAATERNEEWESRFQSLTEQIATLTGAVAALAIQSTPPALSAPDPEPEPEPLPEVNPETMTDTNETETEPSSETKTEAPEGNAGESLDTIVDAVLPVPARPKVRMI